MAKHRKNKGKNEKNGNPNTEQTEQAQETPQTVPDSEVVVSQDTATTVPPLATLVDIQVPTAISDPSGDDAESPSVETPTPPIATPGFPSGIANGEIPKVKKPGEIVESLSVPMAISLFPSAFEDCFGIPAAILPTKFKDTAYHAIKTGTLPKSAARKAFEGLLPGGPPIPGSGTIPLNSFRRVQQALMCLDVLEALNEGQL